ncbi:MAG: hypothetical protein E6G97_18295 [Alphaproteobacteria bacterium]|nr:MAG: hypothetical protein E6G97_18295 [Alphaproteobacteria bacterium]
MPADPILLDSVASATQPFTGRRVLEDLLRAKAESDRKNYPAKHAILRRLIRQSPDDFATDSEDANFYGLTHLPTRFRVHMPKGAIPDNVVLKKAESAVTNELEVLDRLDELLDDHGDKVLALKDAAWSLPALAHNEHDLNYDLKTGKLLVHAPGLSRTELAPLAKIASLQFLQGPCVRAGKDEVAHIKRSYSPTARAVTDLLHFTDGPVNTFTGGANPMAASLLGGLAGAGMGYAGGAAVEQLGGGHLQKKRLRRALAALGGAVGASPGAYWGWHSLAQQGPPGWLPPDDSLVKLAQALRELLPDVRPREAFCKKSDTGALFEGQGLQAAIPVDGFNNVVWSAQDPFTPPSLRSAAAGLIQTASLSRGGSPVVTPYDIARLGVGMGSGLASGWVAGRVLGALAGLSPEAQQGLQRAGMWAGVLRAVVPPVYGQDR